jgi:hypothetical protein
MAVNRQAVPYAGPWNRGGRHEAWDGLDVDNVLADLGYRPEPRRARRPTFFGMPMRATRCRPFAVALAAVKQEEEEDAAAVK